MSESNAPAGGTLAIMFGKAPIPGRVKTRLTALLSPEKAAELYRCFLLDQAERLMAPRAGKWLSMAGDHDHPITADVRAFGVQVVQQGGGTLGDRMADAIERGLAAGFERVVLLGSDSPTLPSSFLDEADALLEANDVVIGPGFDGGFTLIGTRVPLPELRHPIAWSTTDTLRETDMALKASNRLVAYVGFWYDVDEPGDLELLAGHLLGWETRDPDNIAPRTARWLSEHGYGPDGDGSP